MGDVEGYGSVGSVGLNGGDLDHSLARTTCRCSLHAQISDYRSHRPFFICCSACRRRRVTLFARTGSGIGLGCASLFLLRRCSLLFLKGLLCGC